MKKFKEDLKNGKKYELWFANNFLNDFEINENEDDFKKFDILSESFSYEIKTDKQCFVYYRFGFEVSSYDKPSGIWATESDYWVTIVPIFNKVFILKVDDVKDFIKNNQEECIVKNCGDNYKSRMILWDWDYFLKTIKEYKDTKIIDIKVPNLYGKGETRKLLNDFLRYYNREDREIRCNNNKRMEKHYSDVYKKINKNPYE